MLRRVGIGKKRDCRAVRAEGWRPQTWGCLAAASLAVALGLDGCRSGIETCEPGDVRACPVPSCRGRQECRADGTFGPCDCGGSAGTGAAGAAGSSLFGGTSGSGFDAFAGNGGALGSAGIGGAGGFNSPLGRPCRADDACDGLECLTTSSLSQLGNGGPAGGYCSYPCVVGSDDCQFLGFGAECIDFGSPGKPNGYCMQGCRFGPPAQVGFDPKKCQGRADRACSPALASVGTSCVKDSDCGADLVCAGTCSRKVAVCLPQCNDDAECDGGFKCDPRSGLCRSTIESGKAIGAACTMPPVAGPDSDAGDSGSDGGRDSGVDAASDSGPGGASDSGRADGALEASPDARTTDECRGFCQPFTSSPGKPPSAFACSERCTLGVVFSCGSTQQNGISSLCMAEALERGVGDMGVCVQLCDCDANCAHPDFVCNEFQQPSVKTLTNHQGYCGLAIATDGGVRSGIRCASDAAADVPSADGRSD